MNSKIKDILFFLLSIVTLVLSQSCADNPVREQLLLADEVIETAPEESLKILSVLDRNKLTSGDAAYYSLLFTQAQVKTDIAVSNDSLIQMASDYFKVKESGNLGIRTQFYMGVVASNSGEETASMRYFLEAYEQAKRQKDFYWVAKSAEQISDIFRRLRNFTQAKQYTEEAITNYRKAGKERNVRFALCDLASIYQQTDKDMPAQAMLDSLYNLCINENPIDSVLVDYLYIPLMTANLNNEQQLPLQGIEEIVDDRQPLTSDLDRLLLNIFINQDSGNYTASQKELYIAREMTMRENDEWDVKLASYFQAIHTSDFREAAFIADTLLYMQHEITEKLLNESVTSAQRDYYSNAMMREAKEKVFMKNLVIGICIVGCFIVTLILIIVRQRTRRQRAELESALMSWMHSKEEADNIAVKYKYLSEHVATEKKEHDRVRQMLDDKTAREGENAILVEKLFKEKWATLNMLCSEFFEKDDSETSRKSILNNIRQELKKLRSKKSLHEIEESVNSYMGGLITLLREECDFLKEEDYVFLSLLYAGLSARSTSLFLDIKYKMVFLKKSRLAQKILASDAPHKSFFIEKLGIRTNEGYSDANPDS